VFYVDGGVDDEPTESQRKTQRNERKPESRRITRKREYQQHDRTDDIRRHGVQIRFNLVVTQPTDDLREEKRDGLEWDAEADFDEEEAVGGGVGEDLEGVAQVEGLVYGGGTVDLDAFECESFFGGGEEGGFGGGGGEVPVGDEGDWGGMLESFSFLFSFF
jgi:hypothetical protein